MNTEVDAWEIAPRFSDLLANTSIQFVQDKVKLLDPCDHFDARNPKSASCGGTVYLESGLHIEYDWYFFNFLLDIQNLQVEYIVFLWLFLLA